MNSTSAEGATISLDITVVSVGMTLADFLVLSSVIQTVIISQLQTEDVKSKYLVQSQEWSSCSG